jgi:hypothetical protein
MLGPLTFLVPHDWYKFAPLTWVAIGAALLALGSSILSQTKKSETSKWRSIVLFGILLVGLALNILASMFTDWQNRKPELIFTLAVRGNADSKYFPLLRTDVLVSEYTDDRHGVVTFDFALMNPTETPVNDVRARITLSDNAEFYGEPEHSTPPVHPANYRTFGPFYIQAKQMSDNFPIRVKVEMARPPTPLTESPKIVIKARYDCRDCSFQEKDQILIVEPLPGYRN